MFEDDGQTELPTDETTGGGESDTTTGGESGEQNDGQTEFPPITPNGQTQNGGSHADRINQFLYEYEHVSQEDYTKYIKQIAADTGVDEDDVGKVVGALLDILEDKKSAKGIMAGQAYPAYIVNHHSRGFNRGVWGNF